MVFLVYDNLYVWVRGFEVTAIEVCLPCHILLVLHAIRNRMGYHFRNHVHVLDKQLLATNGAFSWLINTHHNFSMSIFIFERGSFQLQTPSRSLMYIEPRHQFNSWNDFSADTRPESYVYWTSSAIHESMSWSKVTGRVLSWGFLCVLPDGVPHQTSHPKLSRLLPGCRSEQWWGLGQGMPARRNA